MLKFRYLILLIITCGLAHANPGAPFRQSVSFNGIWDFYPNGDDKRFDIRVPSFWDAPQDYGYPMEWLHMLHGVYRKEFYIPAEMKDKHIFLQIKRVSVIATVFVNGHQVGAEESNGYLMMQLPYLIDITDVANVGTTNHVEIKVWGGQQETYGEGVETEWTEKDFPDDVLDDGKMRYPWCVDHYDGRRGVNGDVALVAYPQVYIDNVFVMPDLNKNRNPHDDRISIAVTVANKSGSIQEITIGNTINSKQGATFDNRLVSLAAGETRTIIWENISWINAEYWWPHNPHLYNLQTVLTVDHKMIDVLRTRFGFRQFYVSGNHYELNGIRANLRAESFEFSWHEGYIHGPSTGPVLSTKELTADVQERLMKAYQELNLNTLRVHKASGIDATFDIADTLGMLVIDEAPFWQTQQRTDERAAPYFQTWVRQWIKTRRNHPSIIMWSICNECWGSPIAEFTYDAAKEMDPTRPAYHQGIRAGNFAGDEECVHYTGGYPYKAFNTDSLYSLYVNNTDKPKGEGESMFAEGFPLKNADGSLSNKRAERGQWDHPDLVSQAEWVRGVCRFIRAMRFAELADSRSYMNWIYAFEVIEENIYPEWPDLTAPEIKPIVLHRPVCNMVVNNYPEIIKGDGHTYWANSHAPVAVFDVPWDRENRIGIEPHVYKSGDTIKRKLVIYNDEFDGGDLINVDWSASIQNPQDDTNNIFTSGAFVVNIPYGEKRMQPMSFRIPYIEEHGWLVLTLKASKNNQLKFSEANRLGALNKIPDPKLVISNNVIEVGTLSTDTTQWKKIKLVNLGGGLSVKWKVKGVDDVVSLNQTSGNLRGEQEVYVRIHPDGLVPGLYEKTLTFVGQHGSHATCDIRFAVGENKSDATPVRDK